MPKNFPLLVINGLSQLASQFLPPRRFQHRRNATALSPSSPSNSPIAGSCVQQVVFVSERMAETELSLPSDVMVSGFNHAKVLEQQGVVDMNIFNEDILINYEKSPAQLVPEDTNALNNDLWVPQNQEAAPLEYHTLHPVKSQQAQDFTDFANCSPEVFPPPLPFGESVWDWENCPTPRLIPGESSQEAVSPMAMSPMAYDIQFSTDLSRVACPVDATLFEDYPSPVSTQVLAPAKIQLLTPPARYNKRKVPAQKPIAASPARRGRGTKCDPKSSVKRHREKISNYLQSAPEIIANLTAMNGTMDAHVNELDRMRRYLHELLNPAFAVPQGPQY